MKEALLLGLGIGFTICFLVGPVFFTLLQTSIQKGFLSGAALSIGITISDTLITCSLLFGVSGFAISPIQQLLMAVSGGIFLLFLGIKTALKKQLDLVHFDQYNFERKLNFVKQVVKGFTLNILHPGVWIFWLGSISIISLKSELTDHHTLTVLLVAIATIFFTDLLKAYLASLIKQRLTAYRITIINRMIGALIAVSGLVIVTTQLAYYFNQNTN